MNIYVNCNACKDGNGTKESPYRFINDAAQAAAAGDEILVAPGIYREYVDPKNAGTENAIYIDIHIDRKSTRLNSSHRK